MPKRGKLNKQSRDRAMIAGVRKHRAVFDQIKVGPERWDADDVIAIFDRHSKSIDEIAHLDAMRTEAIAREKDLERALSLAWRMIVSLLRGHFGPASQTLRDFGIKPQRKKRLSVAEKAVAVAKRKATRKLRGTMGPKQRRKKERGY